VSSAGENVLLTAQKRYDVFIFQGNSPGHRINYIFFMDRFMAGDCAGCAQGLVRGRAAAVAKNGKKTLPEATHSF
jgi:hypothetical protein